MDKRTIYILFMLLLVNAGCGPSATQAATPMPTPTPRPEGWAVMETADHPSPRTDHAMTMLPDGSVLLFGGRDVDGNALGDTWIIKPEASSYTPPSGGRRASLARLAGTGVAALWTILPLPVRSPRPADWSPITPPDSPSARLGYSMVTLPDGRVLLFGGTDNQGAWFNDLYTFEAGQWSPTIPDNDPPSARSNHNAWVWNERMYVQGGMDKTSSYEDLWLYDLPSNTWQQLQDPPDLISPNAHVAIHDHKAYFIDPHRCSPAACTVNFYDMLKDKWEKIELVGEWPLVQAYSMMVQAGTKAYLMGGANWDQNTQVSIPIAEVWQMDLGTLTWMRLEDMPYPGYNGKAVYDPYQNRIITFGGMILLDGEKKYSSDTRIWWLKP